MRDSEKPDMERDILNSFIKDKAYHNDVYCQHLYAALCNNEFVYGDMLEVIKGDYWGCSWRYAAGFAASLFEGTTQGDYLRYYTAAMTDNNEYVDEKYITGEIRSDLAKINWYPVANSYDNDES